MKHVLFFAFLLFSFCLQAQHTKPSKEKPSPTAEDTLPKERLIEAVVEEEPPPPVLMEVGEVDLGEKFILGSAEHPYSYVEQMPVFPGGQDSMFLFLGECVKNNVKPTVAGKAMVQFVILADGTISNVRLMRGVDPAMNKSTLECVRSMPKWKPGKQDGKAVAVNFILPIQYTPQ